MTFRKILAWGVHLYTALGLVAAACIVVLIIRGGDEAFRAALGLMIVATIIDSTDGWMARRANVKKYAPTFDGRKLDDLIDFQNYTSLPLLLIWRAEILPGEQAWWLLLPLLASAYGFSQSNAKTDDGFFLGFPSYWNIVAFYLYLLRPEVAVCLFLIIALSLLTFIPWRYLYPSQRGRLNRLTTVLAVIWTLLLLVVLARWQADPRTLLLISLAFPIYYMVMSWTLTLRRARSQVRDG